jgi:hypothetical protein
LQPVVKLFGDPEENACFSPTATLSPVRGLRPMRASCFLTAKRAQPAQLDPITTQ